MTAPSGPAAPPSPPTVGARPDPADIGALLAAIPLDLAASAAAAILIVTGQGPVVVAAVLLGLGARDVRVGLIGVLAAVGAAVRFGAVEFVDLAGLQSVAGPAGRLGPDTAAAGWWMLAAAVVLSVRRPRGRGRLVAVPALVAAGALAAVLVAGPGPDDLATRLGAVAAGTAMAALVSLTERWTRVAAVRGVVGLLVAVVGVGVIGAA